MMQEKINIAELLKDCPTGMELDCTMYDNLYFDSLNADYYGTINCYTLIAGTKTSIGFTKYGTFNDHMGAKCVIFPKGKTTWEGFHRPFRDGDILAYQNAEFEKPSIYIYKYSCELNTSYYVVLSGYDSEFMVENRYGYALHGNDPSVRFATEEEKQKLFDVIKAKGYKWNEETKTLEKLIESKFKDGDILATVLGSVFLLNTRLNTDECYGCYAGIGGGLFHICEPFAYKECCRLATEEEKQKLFDVIKENGYKWNAETKTLEKLTIPKFKVGDKVRHKDDKTVITITGIKDDYYFIQFYNIRRNDYQNEKVLFKDQDKYELVPSKFDITTLKPFDKVLVRDGAGLWRPNLFGKDMIFGYRYFTSSGNYKECIPYEGNEHLLGTTGACDEYYKTWEQ